MVEEANHTPSHHSNKWYGNHPEVARPKPPNLKSSPAGESHSFTTKLAYYLDKAGVVSLLLAIGAVLMDSMFWWFVTLVVLALMLSIFAVVIDRSHGRSRYVFAILFVIVMILFVWKIVVGTVFPEIKAEWTDGNYAPGSNVNGITWQGDWSHLTVSVFNNSHVDLKDVDIELSVPEWVAAASVDGDPNCSVIANGRPVTMTARSQDGSQQIIPRMGERSPHRLLCGKLPANTGVRIIAALINDKGENHKKMMPPTVDFHAIYKAGPRPYDWEGEVKPQRY